MSKVFPQYQGGSNRVFPESKVKEIHEASVYLMEKVGVKVHNPRARQIFADHGADVDHAGGIVKIPRSMLEDAIAAAPSRVVLCGREEKNDLVLEGTNTYLGTGGRCYIPWTWTRGSAVPRRCGMWPATPG